MEEELFAYSHMVEFNNKSFMVLYGETTPLYILEVKDNKIQYPVYEDYECYLKKHVNRKKIFNIIGMSDIKNRVLKFKPGVIFKNTIIAATVAMALAGCKPENMHLKQEINYSILRDDSIYESYDENNNNNFEELKKAWLEQQGYEITDCGVNTGKLKNFHGTVHITPEGYIQCVDLNEFRQVMGITSLPTYDDVIRGVENNSTIPDDVKTMIIDYLNKMRTLYPNLDLTLLYENYKTIKFVEISEQEIRAIGGNKDSLAHYDEVENTVRYSRNPSELSFEMVIAHEAIGHVLNECYTKKVIDGNEVGIFMETSIYPIIVVGQSTNYRTFDFAMAECFADSLGLSVTGEKRDNSDCYCLFDEYINILKQILDVDYDELYNMKGINIYKALADKGVNNIMETHFRFETYMNDYNDGILKQGDRNFEKIIKDILIDWKSDELNSGNQELIDQAIEDIITVLNNKIYDTVEIGYKNKKGIDKYDPDELIEYFQEFGNNVIKRRNK